MRRPLTQFLLPALAHAYQGALLGPRELWPVFGLVFAVGGGTVLGAWANTLIGASTFVTVKGFRALLHFILP